MIDRKTCTECGEEKGLNEFNRAPRGRFGRQSKCKRCCARYAARYRAEKRESLLRKRAAYRERNREELRQKQAAYRKEHREELRSKQNEYRAKNRDVDLARKRAYWEANPHVGWAKVYRARAEGELVIEDFTKPDVVERYGDACFYCGGEFESLDHYIPVSAGGPHTLDNVRPSCVSCNSSKRSTPGDQWAADEVWSE